ncbi:MAG: hypothetical protein Ct9H90mP13_08060 [Pseudomonadota bacterium]|nr:MAG: hypothetical protein Ct9H90mP13_08060 [Pseudomonadota bacterium]
MHWIQKNGSENQGPMVTVSKCLLSCGCTANERSSYTTLPFRDMGGITPFLPWMLMGKSQALFVSGIYGIREDLEQVIVDKCLIS